MTHPDLKAELAKLLDDAGKQEMSSHFPPATPTQIVEVTARAVKELGMPLAPEYVSLARIFNGGGYHICFYATHDRVILNPFKQQREEIDLGIIDRNRELRKMEMIDANEVAYAESDDCVFMPDPATGAWIGRDRITREVMSRFATFLDLVREAYG